MKQTNSVLMYTISVDGVAGKVSKAHFYSPSLGVTVLNLLPVIGAQSFNGHVMVRQSSLYREEIATAFVLISRCRRLLRCHYPTRIRSQTI